MDTRYRGNDDEVAGRPDPKADNNLVRHVLYLGGFGRSTPYLSITPDRDEAADFGIVWETNVVALSASGVKHLPTESLIAALKNNRGPAKAAARERQRALKYVELHREELADYRGFADASAALVAVTATFARSK